jgi:hypothetical protein
MPGVRYGPDISDDAAYILNQIVSLQDVEADLKRRGRKLTDRDSKTLARNVKAAQTFFGVSAADIKKRKFGDMGTLAQYSMDGINLSRRKRGANGKWVYSKSKRAKLAKGKDGIEKRTVADEHVKYRGANPGRTFISASSPKKLQKQLNPVGGGTYLGRTSPRKFMDAQKRFYDRMSKKGAVSYGGQPARKIRGQDDLDKVNIAKVNGKSIRPRMVTSRPGGKRKAAPKTPAQLKREKTIATAGRRGGKMSTAKKARGAKKPTTPRKRAR